MLNLIEEEERRAIRGKEEGKKGVSFVWTIFRDEKIVCLLKKKGIIKRKKVNKVAVLCRKRKETNEKYERTRGECPESHDEMICLTYEGR